MVELNVIRLFNGIKDVNLLLFLKFTILAVLLVLVGASVPHTLAATSISFGVSSSVNGSQLNGMYTVLYSQSGAVVSTGFTPVTFNIVAGRTYQIQVANYGPYTFCQWGNGKTANPLIFSRTNNGGVTADYTSNGSCSTGGGSSKLGIIVPLYAYPNSVWQSLLNYHNQYPKVPMLMIVNPSEGVGSYRDATIASWIKKLQNSGITVLGYVNTGYTSISITSIENQIYLYQSWYGIKGVFLDEMWNVAGSAKYYSTITKYAHSIGMSFVVGNPGTSVDRSYIGTVDNIGIYENSGLPSVHLIQSYTMGYPRTDFSFISYYDGPLPSQSYFNSMSSLVSYLYVTDQSQAYATLPSYFSQELAAIQAS